MNDPSTTLADTLERLARPGELFGRLDDGSVRCFACAHRCLIRPGRRGICQVRFNREGVLYVPHGYAAGVQVDPIEKKPFNHVMPGSDALTFGMLGCDMHCSYCFTGDTVVITDKGPMSLSEVFTSAESMQIRTDGAIAYHKDLSVVSGSGRKQRIVAAFKHPYRGLMTVIRPYYLPSTQCTPDHRIYATDNPEEPPRLVEARYLTEFHYIAIPRKYAFTAANSIDVVDLLGEYEVRYRVPYKYSHDDYNYIVSASEQGQTSREIASKFGTSASNLRHIRRRSRARSADDVRSGKPIIENGTIRFPNERRPGIPTALTLDPELAWLLGLYCAEGSVTTDKKRPNSHTLSFSFSHSEATLVDQVIHLLATKLGVEAAPVHRPTTLAVAAGKSSAALFFKSLAGAGSAYKRVPPVVFDSQPEIASSFLDAFVTGDGHRYRNGKVSITTVSAALATGVAWLALKLGYLPSIYASARPADGMIEGRRVRQAPVQYAVVWYEHATIKRRIKETEDYYLVPLRSVEYVDFTGDVYNLEVEEEHNYLANFVLVSNCQNWLTSQTLRDAAAGASPVRISGQQLVDVALRSGASTVVSSYNEPLITSEWAVEVFRQARERGLLCGFVSNGNATAEALDFIRPWAQCYKIDLKTMNDRNYRHLGAVLAHILDGIRMVHERGFWLEIVTLVIPGFNDSQAELRQAAEFIASVSPDIPWHVTAFHQDYKMTDPRHTTARDLVQAAEIGKEAGLHFVYAGNLPGRVGPWENTWCPACNQLLIERHGYVLLAYNLTADGACPACGARIPGLWPHSPADVRLSETSSWFSRTPKRVRV